MTNPDQPRVPEATEPGVPAPAVLAWMLALFFVSGVSGLMYEVIWLRKLTLIFGNTAFAVSTVLAAFMAGLGFGSLWFGRLVEGRQGRELMWYVWLEVGIGIFGLISLPLLDAFGPLYVWLYRAFGTTGYVMGLVRLVCAFVALLPATLLMGGTLPVLCRYFIRDDRSLGSIVAKLYGANTLGAMAGCFAASFIFIGTLGMVVTVWLGAVLNFLAAIGALLLSRSVSAAPEPEAEATPEEGPAEPASFDLPHWHPRLFLVLVALCGFCSLAYEGFWTRLLSHIIGINVQAFGLMLFTFLMGIGLGSVIVSRLEAKPEERLRLFIILEILIGCFGLLSLTLFIRHDWFGWLAWKLVGAKSVEARTVIRFAKCMGIMAVPALLMGAAFPVAATLYAQVRDRVGQKMGTIYAWNTFGAILGSLASGFVLMPLIGTTYSIILVAILNLLVGVALVPSCPGLYRGARGVFTSTILTLCVLGCLYSATTSAKRPVVYSAKRPDEFIVKWHAEDVSGSVCVLEGRDDGAKKEVNINGISVAYTEYGDLRIQKLLAHLPLLVHRDPKDVLIVGFGSGSTSGATVQHPVKTECVELQRLETITAQFFTHLNRNVLANPNFKIHINDGRNFLLMTDKRYDVISRDTLPPKTSQDLFSLEFYELCRTRLRPGGVVCGFLPTDLCPTADYFKLLVRTFATVFPEASLWYVGPECSLLLGQQEKFEVDYASVARRASAPGVKADLAMIHATDPIAFLSSFIAAGDRLREFVGPGEVATDDRPLGYVFDDLGLPFGEASTVAQHLIESREPITKYLVNVGDTPDERKAVLERFDKTFRAMKLVMEGRQLAWNKQLPQAAAKLRKAMETSPENMDIGAAYYAARAAKEASSSLLDKALMLASRMGRTPKAQQRSRELIGAALTAARQATQLAPDLADAYRVLGEVHQVMGNRTAAFKAYQRALEINPELHRAERGLRALMAMPGPTGPM